MSPGPVPNKAAAAALISYVGPHDHGARCPTSGSQLHTAINIVQTITRR